MVKKRKVKRLSLVKIICLIIGITSLISAAIVIFIDPKDDFNVTTSVALLAIGLAFTGCGLPTRRNRTNDDSVIK